MVFLALRASHFINPIRLVLPGIIVSLIGGAAGYYIFNNPDKIRGKNSRTAWDNLVRFEKIYESTVEETTCQYGQNLNQQYFEDLIHLQEMTIENLNMLKNDGDIDKLMSAIINLRIDTYTQLKNITKDFIDTLNRISQVNITTDAEYNELLNQQTSLQMHYIINREHINFRDTTLIKNLGAQLIKNYKNFSGEAFNIRVATTLDTIKNRMLGNWSMITDETNATIRFNKIPLPVGVLKIYDRSVQFTWKFENDSSNILLISSPEFKDGVKKWRIIHCTDKILQYQDKDLGDMLLIACRIKE